MFNRSKCVVLAAVLILAAVIFLAQPSLADPEACSVSSLPSLVGDNSDINFQFYFTNTDPSSTIDWITVTTPSSTFSIVSESASGWNAFSDPSGAEFDDGSLAPGESVTLNVEVQTGVFQGGEIDWGIYSYENSVPGDLGNNVCQNNTPLDMVDNTPYISNVLASNLTPGSATITWTTSIPASSQVDYGLDDTYGTSTDLDSNGVTSHSVTINNLNVNTGYHYQVESTTPQGGDDLSGDNTFLTELNVPDNNNNPPVTSNPTVIPTKTITKGKNPPGISLDTAQVPKVSKTVPTILGTASDKQAVTKIEYSTDSGQNWQLVNQATGLGTKSVSFSFTPLNLSDGTYHIEAEAFNSSGDTAITPPVTLVIDRIPPQIGGSIITVGPQILQPNANGLIEALVGVDQKITVHSIGGPISVSILSQLLGSASSSSNFQLTQDPSTGLWSGILSFTRPGSYQLTIRSVNGVGQVTDQYLQTIESLAPAQVISAKTGDVIKVATTTLYYKDIDSGDWVVWDGAAYGELNPQISSNGRVHLLIPPGTYYLKITAAGYKPLISRIFLVQQSLPLSASLALHPLASVDFGLFHLSLPSFSVSSLSINSPKLSSKIITSPLVGRAFPSFSLQSTDGTTKTQLNLYGKPTIVSVLSTWSPTTIDQLSVLASLQKNPNINVEPIFIQDSLASTSVYLQTNGYNLTALADPGGTLVQPLQVGYLPTYYFLDQSGNIKKVMVGVLSKSELQSAVTGL
jgi:hypothetical protein